MTDHVKTLETHEKWLRRCRQPGPMIEAADAIRAVLEENKKLRGEEPIPASMVIDAKIRVRISYLEEVLGVAQHDLRQEAEENERLKKEWDAAHGANELLLTGKAELEADVSALELEVEALGDGSEELKECRRQKAILQQANVTLAARPDGLRGEGTPPEAKVASE